MKKPVIEQDHHAILEANKYSVRALKTMQGNDGLIVRCNLYYEKKKIAECFDDGNGGMLEINFLNYNPNSKEMEEMQCGASVQFEKFLEAYPEQVVDISEAWMKELYPTGFKKIDNELFVGGLITKVLRSQDLKKDLKKKILFVNKKQELRATSYKGCKSITAKHIEHFKMHPHEEGVISILNEMPFDMALTVYESHSE